ncbi:hypothetical protein [Rickettsiella endosymbiont of Aleochara curtula]|uniref:hypothetical protein n=1 Tax=Rickettsiella endosymbiont of Aleochara curtula TaxID=3077936 RepID=UPI00313EB8C7
MSKHLRISESTNSFFQNAVLSTIFVFKSNIYQIGSIFEKILAPILFPLVIIPDAIASLFALYHFASAKNKNLGKTFDLIHAPIKTALVFTAVFAGLSLIFVQGLFLTAVGSSVVYHLGLSILHAYHWLKSEKNSPSLALHRSHTINNFIASTIGGIVIAGIILTMVVAPYLAVTILAAAGITAATLLMLTTIFAIYRNFKNPPVYPTIDPVLSDENSENFEDSDSLLASFSDEELSILSKNQNSNYYHREFRWSKLTGNQEENKTFLLEEIESKKCRLQQQITSSRNSFFERFWPEEPKRQAKIDFLGALETKITSNDRSELSIPNQACQSFFRAVGDTEDLFQATKEYFQYAQG